MTWDEHPVVITVAPTGAEVTRDDNPALPHSPEEIAADVIASARAGAAIAHLHVREDDGTPSSRADLFVRTINLIKRESDIVTNVSTGGAVWMSMDERMTGLAARPDMAGIETGSLNFGEDPFVTTPAQARRVVEQAVSEGVALEAELFDVGHVVRAVAMIQSGELPGPLRANLVFGVPGGVDASPSALRAMLRPLPNHCYWSVTAVGRHQRRMLALGLLYGASGIRVGFEDSVYVRRGVLASSNEDLVVSARELVHSIGRRVATIDEARDVLALSSRRSDGMTGPGIASDLHRSTS